METNWDQFAINANVQHAHNTDINHFNCNIDNTTLSAAQKFFLEKTAENVQHPPIPWWHPNKRTAIKYRQRIFKTF